MFAICCQYEEGVKAPEITTMTMEKEDEYRVGSNDHTILVLSEEVDRLRQRVKFLSASNDVLIGKLKTVSFSTSASNS
jgi:hypothetical protein